MLKMRSLTPPQRTAAKDACFVAVGFVGAAAAAHAIRRAARKLEDNKRPGTALALRATAQGVRSAVVAAVESLVVWRRKFEPTLDCASCLTRVDGAGLSAIAQSAAWGGAAQFGLDQAAKLLARRVLGERYSRARVVFSVGVSFAVRYPLELATRELVRDCGAQRTLGDAMAQVVTKAPGRGLLALYAGAGVAAVALVQARVARRLAARGVEGRCAAAVAALARRPLDAVVDACVEGAATPVWRGVVVDLLRVLLGPADAVDDPADDDAFLPRALLGDAHGLGRASSARADEIQRISYIPLRPGVRPEAIVDKMEAVTAPLRSFPGLVDLQVLAVSNARLLTHARWSPSAAAVTTKGRSQYVSGPSTHAAKRALILFVLKDFLSGAPDTIVQGGFAFEVVGKAVPAGDRVACRVTVFCLKDRRALDAMLAICQKNHAALEDLEGLLEIQAFADRDASRLVMKALYDTKMNLDSAALQFGAIILPPSKSLHAVAPEVSISELVWSMDPDCRHARPGLRRAPSFTDSFAWVSG